MSTRVRDVSAYNRRHSCRGANRQLHTSKALHESSYIVQFTSSHFSSTGPYETATATALAGIMSLLLACINKWLHGDRERPPGKSIRTGPFCQLRTAISWSMACRFATAGTTWYSSRVASGVRQNLGSVHLRRVCKAIEFGSQVTRFVADTAPQWAVAASQLACKATARLPGRSTTPLSTYAGACTILSQTSR